MLGGDAPDGRVDAGGQKRGEDTEYGVRSTSSSIVLFLSLLLLLGSSSRRIERGYGGDNGWCLEVVMMLCSVARAVHECQIDERLTKETLNTEREREAQGLPGR